jgi:hypothetical protein
MGWVYFETLDRRPGPRPVFWLWIRTQYSHLTADCFKYLVQQFQNCIERSTSRSVLELESWQAPARKRGEKEGHPGIVEEGGDDEWAEVPEDPVWEAWAVREAAWKNILPPGGAPCLKSKIIFSWFSERAPSRWWTGLATAQTSSSLRMPGPGWRSSSQTPPRPPTFKIGRGMSLSYVCWGWIIASTSGTWWSPWPGGWKRSSAMVGKLLLKNIAVTLLPLFVKETNLSNTRFFL